MCIRDSIHTMKENFKGVLSFIGINKDSGDMDLYFQLKAPGINFDLSHACKGKSTDWFFFSCYNSEKANTLLEVNASQNDKDFIMAVNWKKAAELVKAGKGRKVQTEYAHNKFDEKTHTATSTMKKEVTVLSVEDMKEAMYLICLLYTSRCV